MATYLQAVNRILRSEGILRGDDDNVAAFTDTQHAGSIELARVAIEQALADLSTDEVVPLIREQDLIHSCIRRLNESDTFIGASANRPQKYKLNANFSHLDDPLLYEVSSLLPNGHFTGNDDTGWVTTPPEWTITDNHLDCDGSQSDLSNFYGSTDLFSEKNEEAIYEFELFEVTAGSIRIGGTITGDPWQGTSRNSIGIYRETLPIYAPFNFQATADFDGKIDNIIVVPKKTKWTTFIKPWPGGEEALAREVADYRNSYGPPSWYYHIYGTTDQIGLYPVPNTEKIYRYHFQKEYTVSAATDTMPYQSESSHAFFCLWAASIFRYMSTPRDLKPQLYPNGLQGSADYLRYKSSTYASIRRHRLETHYGVRRG